MAGPTIIYPLEQILKIKEQRLERAEEELKKRRQELELEKQKLKKAEEARDKVHQHLLDKTNQLYEEFEKGISSSKIIQMRHYLKVVKERLEEENKKVEAQKAEVQKAEDNVELARQEMLRARTAVDKMEMHKKQWIAMAKEEFRLEEEKEQDEVGNILYLKNKKKWS